MLFLSSVLINPINGLLLRERAFVALESYTARIRRFSKGVAKARFSLPYIAYNLAAMLY